MSGVGSLDRPVPGCPTVLRFHTPLIEPNGPTPDYSNRLRGYHLGRHGSGSPGVLGIPGATPPNCDPVHTPSPLHPVRHIPHFSQRSFGLLQKSLMVKKKRTISHVAGILEGIQAHQDRVSHGGPLNGSACP